MLILRLTTFNIRSVSYVIERFVLQQLAPTKVGFNFFYLEYSTNSKA